MELSVCLMAQGLALQGREAARNAKPVALLKQLVKTRMPTRHIRNISRLISSCSMQKDERLQSCSLSFLTYVNVTCWPNEWLVTWLQVAPETPLEKAQKLVEKVLKDANSCRLLVCNIPTKTVGLFQSSKGLRFQAPSTFHVDWPDQAVASLRSEAWSLRPNSSAEDRSKEEQEQALFECHCPG